MNILCSGELFTDPITTDQCLKCSLKMAGKQPCGYGYRLLKAIFSKMEIDKRRNEIHVTDLTGCLAKAYHDKTDPQPRYVHDHLILWLGVAVHDALNFDDENVKSEVEVKNDLVTGRLDAEYADGRIEDAKTTRWLKLSNLPKPEHERQVNIYRNLRNNGGTRLQIQTIDLSGPTKCKSCKTSMRLIDGIVKCPECGKTYKDAHLGAVLMDAVVDDNTGDFVEERSKKLADAIETGVAPDPEPNWLCNYCDHLDKCPVGQIYVEA